MSDPGAAAEHLARLIQREGPIPFDRFVEGALYDPDGGFFAQGRGAGRAGRDFVTSPEVGSLFGALAARAFDRHWEELGRPDPFVVVEAGAGSGRLARDVLRAQPECSPALRYVLVERSASLRAEQRERLVVEPADEALGPHRPGDEEALPVPVPAAGPVVAALADLPAITLDGVVFANELLDNLPFGIARWSGARWEEIRVGLDDAGGFVEVPVPATETDTHALAEATTGLRLEAGVTLPLPRGLEEWLGTAAASLRRGVVVVVDYIQPVATILRREPSSWLRTYRQHRRGSHPLHAPGSQDITADVVHEQLERAAHAAGLHAVGDCSQAEWLAGLGIDEHVEEGRRIWGERAQLGDLEAIAGRSRANEAAALTDPAGLGAHRVVVLTRSSAGSRPGSDG